MIDIPEDSDLLKATKELIEFFNESENKLNQCKTDFEKQQILSKIEYDLIITKNDIKLW
jgi:hypothetical protein